MTDCLFCRIVEGEIASGEVFSDERVYAFEDIQPQAPTHVLVVPRKHIAKLDEATPKDRELLGELLLRAATIARERGLADFRVVANNGSKAGQSVFHVHLHVLGGRQMRWPPG